MPPDEVFQGWTPRVELDAKARAIVEDIRRVLGGHLQLRLRDYAQLGGRYSTREIYQRLGSWHQALSEAGLIHIGPPRGEARGSERPERRCLTCGEPFVAEHRWNFVCEECKHSEAWRDSAPVYGLVTRRSGLGPS